MVKREVLGQYNIVKYQVDSATRANFETWAQLVRADILSWDLTQPYPAVHDFCNIVALTPSLRHYAIQVTKESIERGLPAVYVAVVLKNGLGLRIADIFLTRELDRMAKTVHFQAFNSMERAMEWLINGITAASSPFSPPQTSQTQLPLAKD
jgi:hypothetical protein